MRLNRMKDTLGEKDISPDMACKIAWDEQE